MDIHPLRLRIDAIDGQVLDLLSERARAVLEVGDYKKRHSLPVHDPERENSVVNRMQTDNQGPLSADAVERIYRTIIEQMRKLEEVHVRTVG
jgi:chorismate mutase/prephenate dehydratase